MQILRESMVGKEEQIEVGMRFAFGETAKTPCDWRAFIPVVANLSLLLLSSFSPGIYSQLRD